jgi:hypothetical protein
VDNLLARWDAATEVTHCSFTLAGGDGTLKALEQLAESIHRQRGRMRRDFGEFAEYLHQFAPS